MKRIKNGKIIIIVIFILLTIELGFKLFDIINQNIRVTNIIKNETFDGKINEIKLINRRGGKIGNFPIFKINSNFYNFNLSFQYKVKLGDSLVKYTNSPYIYIYRDNELYEKIDINKERWDF